MTRVLSQYKRVFNKTNWNAITSKSENIFWISFCISGIYIKFGILWKRRWASEVICFWNYTLQKAGLLKCPKSPISEHFWTANMFKRSETLLKSARQNFCQILWSFRKKISSKNSVLVASKISRLFVNIFTPDDKYYLSVKASV